MRAQETDALPAEGSNPRAVQGLQFREPLLFERSSPGRRGHSLPASAQVDGEVAIPTSPKAGGGGGDGGQSELTAAIREQTDAMTKTIWWTRGHGKHNVSKATPDPPRPAP